MLDKLKQRVRELLEAKTVGVVLGYERGDNPKLARPAYVAAPFEAERLVWDETCIAILCKYLLKPEAKTYGRRGIIAKPSDIRGIVGLIQEKQIDRSDVYIIAVSTGQKMPEFYDELIEGPKLNLRSGQAEETDKKIKQLMALLPAERRAFWKKELSKCIKCYACRQICPLCYCRRCIADKNQPPWIPPSPHSKGNFSWNIIRAYHLAGRCIDCGECQRACPVGIPLMLLNRMIYNNIKNNFNYEAGFNPETPPPLATYYPEDKENFII
ncbi:MAG: 4Fe-4S binding protein [Planctomycetota bacterium]